MALRSKIQENSLAKIVAKLVQQGQKVVQDSEKVTDNYGDGSEEIVRQR
jgi:hypothetical protein